MTAGAPTSRRLPPRLFVTAALVAATLVGLALVGGIRRVAYASLAAVVLAGLWPIVLAVAAFAVLLALACLLGIAIGLAGGDDQIDLDGFGEGIAFGGHRLTRWYFRILRRVRHPVAWGMALGLLSGTGIVWLILVVSVIPKERATLSSLLVAQSTLEQRYRSDGRYPEAIAPLDDAFGRPIEYRLKGSWKLASYRLSSVGADGVPSDDDLCVAGGTQFALWVDRIARFKTQLGAEAGVASDPRATLSVLEAARCRP